MFLSSRVVRLCRSIVFLSAALLFAVSFQQEVVSAMPLCSEVCDDYAVCSLQCIDDSDGSSTCGDYNGGQGAGNCAPHCSDICASDVSCDRPCTGAGYCGSYNGGKSNGECFGSCGDGVCEMPYETCNTCSADCGACTETCALNTCTQDSDCGGGDVFCDGACCIGPCGNDYCGSEPRECDNSYEPCGGSPNDCCDNEICGSIDGGDPICVGPLT